MLFRAPLLIISLFSVIFLSKVLQYWYKYTHYNKNADANIVFAIIKLFHPLLRLPLIFWESKLCACLRNVGTCRLSAWRQAAAWGQILEQLSKICAFTSEAIEVQSERCQSYIRHVAVKLLMFGDSWLKKELLKLTLTGSQLTLRHLLISRRYIVCSTWWC